MPRNGWTESIGMGGRLRPELPAGITRNTQFRDLGIEGILSYFIYGSYPTIPESHNFPIPQFGTPNPLIPQSLNPSIPQFHPY
ncbi:hypothetical protein D1AOALGA4SA_1279 [Olavius algarvensis Delta 1 endosymbiont]|nr:hypothetical protein D1AOALGA4SA_1279 [Olavius algarvensis Delta 1 endosymbiont]